MRTILNLTLTFLVLTLVVLDGVAMFVAYQSSREVAEAAAQQAVIEYTASRGNVEAAQAAAHNYAESKHTPLLSIDYHRGQVSWFSAVTESYPDTYVFKHVPLLKDHLGQSYEAVVQF